MSSKSNFIQQLEHETQRIKDIIKKPKLVETKFETLVGIHEGIEEMINNYFESSKKEIVGEAEKDLLKYCDVFKTRWKDDLNNLNEINNKVLRGRIKKNNKGNKENGNNGNSGNSGNSSNVNGSNKNISNENSGNGNCLYINLKSWNSIASKLLDSVKDNIEVFDSSIYGELNEYVDTSLKKEDLDRKEVKEIIKMYNEVKEEIEDGLDELIEEVEDMEKGWMKVKGKLEERGKKELEVLYVCHLNYLDGVVKSKKKVGGNVKVDVFYNNVKVEGKQSDVLRRWICGM